jgi:hypothetical protein
LIHKQKQPSRFVLARHCRTSRCHQNSTEIGTPENLRWDDIGLKALARDWAAWPGTPSDDLMNRSQFNLFRDIGAHLYGNSTDALRSAMDRIALAEPTSSPPVGPQLRLALEKKIRVEGTNVNP